MPESPPRAPAAEHAARLGRVRLLALDVDGTLTDGRVVYVGEAELQSFCVRDGQGLAWLRKAGVKIAWITGRGSPATERRAAELGVDALRTHARDKRAALEEVQRTLGIGPEATAAMGDDLPDLALARRAILFAAPRDARPELRAAADLVTEAPGGAGAVRELCEHILRAQGRWRAIVEGVAP